MADPFWHHVTRVEGKPRSFKCNYCPKVMKSGGSRKIKHHLAGEVGGAVRPCPEVPEDIRQQAKEAVLTVRRYTRRSGSAASVASAPVQVLAIEDARSDLIEIQKGVEKVMKNPTFLHQFPTAVYYYLKDKVSPETNNVGIPKALETLFQRSSPLFKSLTLSYAHMKTLLSKRHLMAEPSFSPECEDVDTNVGSTRYRELVKYLVKDERFWEDGERFVKRFEPMLQLTANMAMSGCTIGHMCRATETAKHQVHEHEQLRVFETEFGNASHLLAKAAELLDPSFVYDMTEFDVIDAMNQFLQFRDLYVLQDDKTSFENDVNTYLNKDNKLFHSSALCMMQDSHPRRWWLYCGHQVEVLRTYAFNLVSLPLSTDLSSPHVNWNALLKAPLSRKERSEDEDLNQYQVADLVSFESWILHGENAVAGLFASWEQLKKLNESCWSLIPHGELWQFYLYASHSFNSED